MTSRPDKEKFGKLLGIDSENKDEIINNFLKFIGVSDNSKFVYADKNIYNKYRNGVNVQFLPAVIGKSPLLMDDIMKNIVIYIKKKQKVIWKK